MDRNGKKPLREEIEDEEGTLSQICQDVGSIRKRILAVEKRLETLRHRAVDQETALILRTSACKKKGPGK